MIYNWNVEKGEILNGANFEIDLSLAPFAQWGDPCGIPLRTRTRRRIIANVSLESGKFLR